MLCLFISHNNSFRPVPATLPVHLPQQSSIQCRFIFSKLPSSAYSSSRATNPTTDPAPPRRRRPSPVSLQPPSPAPLAPPQPAPAPTQDRLRISLSGSRHGCPCRGRRARTCAILPAGVRGRPVHRAAGARPRQAQRLRGLPQGQAPADQEGQAVQGARVAGGFRTQPPSSSCRSSAIESIRPTLIDKYRHTSIDDRRHPYPR